MALGQHICDNNNYYFVGHVQHVWGIVLPSTEAEDNTYMYVACNMTINYCLPWTNPGTVEPHYNGHLGAKSMLLYRGGLFTEWHSKSS